MHVAILSASYSGSTIINLVLGGLPGCYAIGESHWISEEPMEYFFCATCGGDCKILSRDIRERMIKKKEEWYNLALSASDDSVIVSSDKDPDYYIQRQSPDKALILWKDPRAWLYSVIKNDGRPDDLQMQDWVALYERIFDYVEKKNIDAKVIKLDFFSAYPRRYLKKICNWLNVEYTEQSLDTKGPFHYVGGNLMAKGVSRDESYRKTFGSGIRPDNRWRRDFPNHLEKFVLSDEDVQRVVQMLSSYESSGLYSFN